MARKQTSGRLNRFLDLIGLVDNVPGDDVNQESARPKHKKTPRSASADEFDEFEDFEEQAPRRRMPVSAAPRSSRVNVGDDAFREDQGWRSASPSYSSSRAGRARSESAAPSRSSAGTRATSRSGYREAAATNGSVPYERRSYAPSSSGYRASEAQPRYRSAAPSGYSGAGRRDLSDYEPPAPASGSSYQRHQTVIFMLHSVDECKEVILSLIDKKSVLLNLDELDAVQAQRALDTMSGATYAIGATLSRASDRTWLITPSNVEVERPSMDADGYN